MASSTPPAFGADFKQLGTTQIYQQISSGDLWLNKGSALGWEKFPTGGVSQAASVIEKTYVEMQALIDANSLVVGSFYKITDAASSVYGGSVIVLEALKTNKLAVEGYGYFYNPKYKTWAPGLGIWTNIIQLNLSNISGTFNTNEYVKDALTYGTTNADADLITTINNAGGPVYIGDRSYGDWASVTKITNQSGATADAQILNQTIYAINDKVIWGGKVWKNLTGKVGFMDTNNWNDRIYKLDSTNWELVPYNETDYNLVVDKVWYEFQFDFLAGRFEADGNNFVYSPFGYTDRNSWWGESAVKAFQWGNPYGKSGSGVGLANCIIIEGSYFESINFNGTYVMNVLLRGSSGIDTNQFQQGLTRIDDIQLNNYSYIEYTTLYTQYALTNVNLRDNSGIDDNIFENYQIKNIEGSRAYISSNYPSGQLYGTFSDCKLYDATVSSLSGEFKEHWQAPQGSYPNDIARLADIPPAVVGGGGGSTAPIDKTYAELSGLISTSALVPGTKYRITDYQTVHTIPYTSATNTGPVEVLIVTAFKPNELEVIAYSESFPDDIIYYNPTNDQLQMPGCTKGFIYRRVDTLLNNDLPVDFRNAKFRRWSYANASLYSASTTYTKDERVQDASLNVYYSLRNGNVGNALDNQSWWYQAPYIYGETVIAEPLDYSGNALAYVDILTFEDFTMFDVNSYANNYYSGHIQKFAYTAKAPNGQDILNYIHAANNVFKNGSRSLNNTIDDGCFFWKNTFSGGFYFTDNKITTRSKMQKNIWKGGQLQKNTLITYSEISNNLSFGYVYENFLNGSYISDNKIMYGDIDQMVMDFSHISGIMINGSCYDIKMLSSSISGNLFIGGTGIHQCTMHHSSFTGFLGFGGKSLSHIDFKLADITAYEYATYLYDYNYKKTIFKRPDGAFRMSFMNNSDVLQVVQVTT